MTFNQSAEHRTRGRVLYEEIKAHILDGIYPAGSRLLSTRACAAERSLSRSTVSLVYEQLASEGFIDSIAGARSRVALGAVPRHSAATSPLRARKVAFRQDRPTRLSTIGERIAALELRPTQETSPGIVDFAYGPIPGRDFPTMPWRKAARQVEVERPARLTYGDPCGDPSFRQALQAYLARARGIYCDVSQLIVVNGSQQAIDLCARLLVNPGDEVVVENPGYQMAQQVFEVMGAKLCGISVDAHGLVTSELSQRLSARLAYVTPTHQYPLGAFLTMARRQEILSWAKTRQAWIIEDDYDSEYRYAIRPEPTLKSLDDSDRVIYVGTFSKTLSPHLRLGYMIVPNELVKPFAAAKQLIDRHTASAMQRTLARLLDNGSYDRHVRRIRRIQHARCDRLLTALELHLGGQITIQGSTGGLHVVIWIHAVSHQSENDLVALAQREGVMVYPMSAMYLPEKKTPKEDRRAGLVLGYATLGEMQIEEGVQKLSLAIRSFGSV